MKGFFHATFMALHLRHLFLEFFFQRKHIYSIYFYQVCTILQLILVLSEMVNEPSTYVVQINTWPGQLSLFYPSFQSTQNSPWTTQSSYSHLHRFHRHPSGHSPFSIPFWKCTQIPINHPVILFCATSFGPLHSLLLNRKTILYITPQTDPHNKLFPLGLQ